MESVHFWTILGVIVAGFLYSLNKSDSNFKELSAKIDGVDTKLSAKIDKNPEKITAVEKPLSTEISNVKTILAVMDIRISNIENHILPAKVIPLTPKPKHDEPKEN